MAFCDESYNWPGYISRSTNSNRTTLVLYGHSMNRKKEQIEDAIEELRSRFGKQAITYGCLLHNLKMPLDGRDNVKMPGMMYV